MIRLIGDVHSKFNAYKRLLSQSPYPTVQVGDMGVGFINPQTDDCFSNPPYDYMLKNGARFIRGNHDSPQVCKKHSQYIQDGHTETTNNNTRIMYIGGAWSIDGNQRIPNYSWWSDEELSNQEFDKIIINYVEFCPDVMVTHDCPHNISYELFLKGTNNPIYKTRTGQAFEAMLSLYKPKLWCFGHWHMSKDVTIDGVRYICLNELEFLDINV